MEQKQSNHVVLLPTPGMGHLIPFVELARRLVSFHDFSVSFIVPGDAAISKAQKAFLGDLPDRVDYHLLNPANTDDLPPETKIETRLCVMLNRSLPAIRDSLKSLISKNRVVAYVTDFFGVESLKVAKEFNIHSYMFFTSNAMLLSLILYLPELDRKVPVGEYRDLTEPVIVPGCIPVRGRDLANPVQDRKNDAYKHLLSMEKNFRLADGIILNTFIDLEPNVIRTLRTEENNPTIYLVGPIVRQETGSYALEGSECLAWLNAQPTRSVLYVSFGSGGTHTHAQMTELALGLELSQQRFIWVARSPSDLSGANYFDSHGKNDPLGFLPKGFLELVHGRGLVLPSWAPQVQILAHDSTGGFMMHCGWNSTLESIANGVPLIAWPLFGEQRTNSVMLTEHLKVALRIDEDADRGLVGRDRISWMVKALMEGEEGKEMRTHMKILKDASRKAWKEDGPSAKSLEEVALKWKTAKL